MKKSSKMTKKYLKSDRNCCIIIIERVKNTSLIM